jgi:hypothetical protein
MTVTRATALAVIVAFWFVCTGCRSVVELQPEQRARIRVGERATVRVESDHRYAVGSAGSSLTLIKQTEEEGTTLYVYRAVDPGNQTFVLTPRDPGPDGCVSCTTLHYFVTVVR